MVSGGVVELAAKAAGEQRARRSILEFPLVLFRSARAMRLHEA